MGITLRGHGQLQRKLTALVDGSLAVERAAVTAGCVVMSNACKDASPGSISKECGFSVKDIGGMIIGRAGLMRFPRRGDGQNGPHGVYLELGTKFISPRRFIERALRTSRSSAVAASRRAAKLKIRSIASK